MNAVVTLREGRACQEWRTQVQPLKCQERTSDLTCTDCCQTSSSYISLSRLQMWIVYSYRMLPSLVSTISHLQFRGLELNQGRRRSNMSCSARIGDGVLQVQSGSVDVRQAHLSWLHMVCKASMYRNCYTCTGELFEMHLLGLMLRLGRV